MPMQNLLLLTELKALGVRPCRIFLWVQRAAVPPHSPWIGNGTGADGVKLQRSSCSTWTAAAADKEYCSACSISEGLPQCLG